jgi:uncharacterized membrane protein YbhN (UPF0104 family)
VVYAVKINRRRTALALFAALFVAAAGFFLVRNLRGAVDTLGDRSASDLALLLPATALMAIAVACHGLNWTAIVGWLQRGKGFDGRLFRFFLVSWPGRYVPGTMPYHAARVLMAERLGSTKRTVTASIAYEAVLQAGGAALVGVVCVTLALGLSESASSIYVAGLLPMVALPVVLQPRFLTPMANRLLRAAGRQPLTEDVLLGGRETLISFAGYAGLHTLNGLAFYLVLRAVTDASISPLLAVGAFNLAGCAGVAVIFVPSGLGVREAVIVAIVGAASTPEAALLAAGMTRAISIVADLVPLVGVGAYQLATRLRPRSAVVATGEAPSQDYREAA